MMGAVAEDAAATLVFLGKVDERTGAVDEARTTLFDDKSGVAAFFTVAAFFSLPASTAPVGPFFTSTFTPPGILVTSFPPESRPATKGFCFGKGEGDCLLTLATSLLSKLSVLSPFTMLCLLLSLVDAPDVRKENRLEGAAGRLPASSKEPFFVFVFLDTSTSSLLLLLTTSITASSLLLFLLSSSALLFLLLVVVVVSVLSLLMASSLFRGKLEVEWLPT